MFHVGAQDSNLLSLGYDVQQHKAKENFNNAASTLGLQALPATQLSECQNSHIQSNRFDLSSKQNRFP